MDSRFEWIAGNRGLDFVNTVSWGGGEPSGEPRIRTFGDLLDWSREAGLLTDGEYRRVGAEAARVPVDADHVLAQAYALRRVIHSIFAAIAEGVPPRASELAAFNGFLARLPLKIRRSDGDAVYVWDWTGEPTDLHHVLSPIVWSATQLLRSDELGRVKQCADDGCGWLFVDTSRRHNRKWCDMRDCGNRAKARRHYQRRKDTRAGKRTDGSTGRR